MKVIFLLTADENNNFKDFEILEEQKREYNKMLYLATKVIDKDFVFSPQIKMYSKNYHPCSLIAYYDKNAIFNMTLMNSFGFEKLHSSYNHESIKEIEMVDDIKNVNLENYSKQEIEHIVIKCLKNQEDISFVEKFFAGVSEAKELFLMLEGLKKPLYILNKNKIF